MNPEDPIEAALRRRPGDERDYAEPLAALVASPGVRRVRPVVRSKGRTGGLAAIAMLVVLLAAGVGIATIGFLSRPLAGPGGPIAQPQLTGLIGCSGSQPGFSAALISSGDANAETATSGPAAALRALLVSDGSMPATGWRVVTQSESQVQYLAMSGFTFGWVYADMQSGSPEASGIAADGWRVDRSGICDLYAVAPNGHGSATWTVDPAQPYAAGSSELRILVTELACYGDNAVGQLETNVAYGATAVTVTAFVRHGEASQPCTAPPATFASVLHLDRPLGSLALMDGGPYPAKTRAANGQPDSSQMPQMEVTVPPGPVVSPGCSIIPAVGSPDVCGVNPSAAPSAAVSGGPTPAATFLLYVVRQGDYADNIAARFNLQLWELKMANPQIADLNHIVIGETLNIPDAGQMPRPPAAPSPS